MSDAINTVFLVRHRTIDLVAASAATAIREALGLHDRLFALQRDDGFAVEAAGATAGSMSEALSSRADWFNPNTHRHAVYTASAGVIQAAQTGDAWPNPWLQQLVASDRPDLSLADDASGVEALRGWAGLSPEAGVFVQSYASWDREGGVTGLPKGHWPVAGGTLLRFQLWTLAFYTGDAGEAKELGARVAVTRRRGEGLLIHPHVERWAEVSDPWVLS